MHVPMLTQFRPQYHTCIICMAGQVRLPQLVKENSSGSWEQSNLHGKREREREHVYVLVLENVYMYKCSMHVCMCMSVHVCVGGGWKGGVSKRTRQSFQTLNSSELVPSLRQWTSTIHHSLWLLHDICMSTYLTKGQRGQTILLLEWRIEKFHCLEQNIVMWWKSSLTFLRRYLSQQLTTVMT